jgi:RimJ/RimL family protein N-acetyltransferase
MAKSVVDLMTDFVVRPIQPTDAAELVRAHDSLSDETRRRRFFSPHPHLTEAEALHFTGVDHVDREAFLVLVDDRIVAVGRYDRIETDAAEVAFVVGEDWQSHGLATMLLNKLAERALQVGITRFVADTFGDNQAMLAVFRHWAPDRKVTLDSGFLHIEMLIPHAEA